MMPTFGIGRKARTISCWSTTRTAMIWQWKDYPKGLAVYDSKYVAILVPYDGIDPETVTFTTPRGNINIPFKRQPKACYSGLTILTIAQEGVVKSRSTLLCLKLTSILPWPLYFE